MSVTYRDKKYYMTDAVKINREAVIPLEEHTHDFLEIVYIIKGKMVHCVDGKEYAVRHGDMLMINYNQTHSAKGIAGEYFNILIKPEYINSNLDDRQNAFSLLNLKEFEDFRKIVSPENQVVHFSAEEQAYLEGIILYSEKELAEHKIGWEVNIKSALNLLLIALFRKMSLPMTDNRDGISPEVLSYISDRLGDGITERELAQRYFYHPSYFSRLFKETTGQTFTDYLRVIRLEKAAELLLSSDKKVGEIILLVGYSDKTAFYKDFVKKYGISPLKYRKSKN